MRHRALLILAFLILVSVPSFAAITGTLMNSDGKPIAGAKVSISTVETTDARRARFLAGTADPAPLASTQSDAKGAFSLETPKDTIVDLRVDAAGYEPIRRRIERDEELGALALRRAETKSGRITAAGKPVAGAKVMWWYNNAEVVATTDAEGRYSAPDPKNANRLTILHRDYAIVDEMFLMGRTSMARSLDRALVAGSAYSGRVVAEDGQTPAKNAEIVVDGWPLATSGEDGTFTIAHVSPKWETIAARSGALIGLRARNSESTTIRLARAASINGTVRDTKTQTPLANALVRLTPARFDAPDSTEVHTDAKGNYAFSVAPGAYRVTATYPSYDVAFEQVSVAAGRSATKNLTIPQLARISGTVLDEDRQPIAGARVTTEEVRESMERVMMAPMRFRGGDSARSGPDGRFTVRVPESEVHVMATLKGWPAGKSEPVRVAAGERKRGLTVTVPRGYALSGRITDKEGRPIAGVAITSSETPAGGGMMQRIMIGAPSRTNDEDLDRTGSDGTFAVRLKEGTYDLTFRREGYASRTVRGHAVGGDTKSIEATLDPSVDITGRVVRNGVGVEGVRLFSFGGSIAEAMTGPDGSFTLSDLSAGPVRINVTKETDFISDTRNVTAPARDVVIELPPGGRITGRVIDKATRQPITSFQAGISTSRSGGGMMMVGPPAMRSFTSDDGSFTLDNVAAGPVTLTASAPGYTMARVPGLTLEEGKTISDVVIELDTGAKLTGRVTGPNGTPLAGAIVRQGFAGGRGGPPMPMGDSAAATTEANGEFTIEALEPGEKTFDISHPDYLPARKTVEISGREARLDVQLSSGTRVAGVVVTEAGVPVTDASVRAISAGGSASSTRSGAGGQFTFDKLAPGRYTFTASKAGHAEGTLRDYDIAGGAPVRIALKTGGIISGRVSGLSEGELTQTMVEARGPEGSATASVDPSGNYRIEGAPTGTVRVTARMMRGLGTAGGKASAPKSIELAPGDARQVDLEFRSDTVVTGRVTRNGQPLSNANVSFMPRRGGTNQTTANTPTDERGVYTISGLDDGEYNVSVIDMQRLSPFSTTYEVRGSSSFDIDIKSAAVRGRVTDASTGQAIVEAQVNFRPAAGESFFATRSAITDANGMFTVDSIAPGRYNATADKEGYGNVVQDVHVTESGAPDLDFKIARNDGVLLRVVDARDGRQLNATTFVTDLQGRVVSEDMFRFGMSTPEEQRLSLSPGQYRVTVSAFGYAAQTLTITSPSRQTVGLTPGGTLAIRSKSSTPRSARLVDASGQPYLRGGMRQPVFPVDIGTTQLPNIAPGTYTLQFLGPNNAVLDSVQVNVVEGQTMTVDA